MGNTCSRENRLRNCHFWSKKSKSNKASSCVGKSCYCHDLFGHKLEVKHENWSNKKSTTSQSASDIRETNEPADADDANDDADKVDPPAENVNEEEHQNNIIKGKRNIEDGDQIQTPEADQNYICETPRRDVAEIEVSRIRKRSKLVESRKGGNKKSEGKRNRQRLEKQKQIMPKEVIIQLKEWQKSPTFKNKVDPVQQWSFESSNQSATDKKGSLDVDPSERKWELNSDQTDHTGQVSKKRKVSVEEERKDTRQGKKEANNARKVSELQKEFKEQNRIFKSERFALVSGNKTEDLCKENYETKQTEEHVPSYTGNIESQGKLIKEPKDIFTPQKEGNVLNGITTEAKGTGILQEGQQDVNVLREIDPAVNVQVNKVQEAEPPTIQTIFGKNTIDQKGPVVKTGAIKQEPYYIQESQPHLYTPKMQFLDSMVQRNCQSASAQSSDVTDVDSVIKELEDFLNSEMLDVQELTDKQKKFPENSTTYHKKQVTWDVEERYISKEELQKQCRQHGKEENQARETDSQEEVATKATDDHEQRKGEETNRQEAIYVNIQAPSDRNEQTEAIYANIDNREEDEEATYVNVDQLGRPKRLSRDEDGEQEVQNPNLNAKCDKGRVKNENSKRMQLEENSEREAGMQNCEDVHHSSEEENFEENQGIEDGKEIPKSEGSGSTRQVECVQQVVKGRRVSNEEDHVSCTRV